MATLRIRSARAEDLPLVEALEARVQPYRPEDEPEVEQTVARALRAERSNDPRWIPIPPPSPQPLSSETDAFPDMDAFWVAMPEEGCGFLAGVVGAQTFRPGEAIGSGHPLVKEWGRDNGVVELRKLRVDPDWRGLGLGMRLCESVITWAREQGVETLVVNTTTPQLPARRLYEKLGFREKGFSFIGRYELVWMELKL